MADPTPGAPVPPDELYQDLYNEYMDKVIVGEECGGRHEFYILRQAAAWGYAQAMQEREEFISLCAELLQCLEYLDRAYDVPVPAGLLDRAAKRLRGGER
jgi:hypothetical protein